MKAMILAAGRGERMRPLTDHTPKPLLEVGGRPLIVWHLQRLAQAGFRDIVINHAHLGAQIEHALGNGERWGVSIRYSAEHAALETAGGVANALHLLGDQPFLIVNGDVYTDLDFSALMRNWLLRHEQTGVSTLAHLVMASNPPQHPAGDFAIMDGRLTQAGEHKLTYSGVGIYDPALFATVVPGEVAKLAPLLNAAIAEGMVSGEHYQGVWHDIGAPERLQTLDRQLRNQFQL